MDEPIRLDEITVFGGKLSFLIPHDWEEFDSDENTYLYCHPNSDSGWFRVSLNKATVVHEQPAERLKRIFADKNKVIRDEETGNWVHAYERDTEEGAVKIRIYYWIVANVAASDLVREAIFSYTVLSERTQNEGTDANFEIVEPDHQPSQVQ